MKKYFILLALASQAGFANAQTKEEKEPYLTRSLSTDAIKAMKATTAGGSISLKGVVPSEARIEVYISGNNSKHLTKAEA